MSSSSCDPKDAALKSFFLGPQAENGPWVAGMLVRALGQWFEWRSSLFPEDGRAVSRDDKASEEFRERERVFEAKFSELMTRFEAEVPKFSPRYVGHMFSEVSLPAILGHFVALLHNPNNISGESSRIGTAIENEALAALRGMIGLDVTEGAGHFTSGGTVANFEAMVRARERCALWLAAGARARENGSGQFQFFEAAHMGWKRFRELARGSRRSAPWNFAGCSPWAASANLSVTMGEAFSGPVMLVPDHKHYSWKKAASLFGLGDEAFWEYGWTKPGVSRSRIKSAAASRSVQRASRAPCGFSGGHD